MKLAFSTLGCPDWSWGEIFAAAKDLGYDGIEVRGVAGEMNAPNIPDFVPENRTAVLEKLDKSGLAISMFTSGACLGLGKIDENIDEAKDYINLAAAMGVPYVRVMITNITYPTKANLNEAKNAYLEICKHAKKKGVISLIETNGILANSETMATFLEGCDPQSSGVLWDIHHPYRFYEEVPATTYQNLKNWIRYVHIKDSIMENGQVKYRMVGFGDVPIKEVVTVLKQNGYTGYLSLEWVKRWCPELEEAGIVFSHYLSQMRYVISKG